MEIFVVALSCFFFKCSALVITRCNQATGVRVAVCGHIELLLSILFFFLSLCVHIDMLSNAYRLLNAYNTAYNIASSVDCSVPFSIATTISKTFFFLPLVYFFLLHFFPQSSSMLHILDTFFVSHCARVHSFFYIVCFVYARCFHSHRIGFIVVYAICNAKIVFHATDTKIFRNNYKIS